MSQSSLVDYRDYGSKHWNDRKGNGIKRIVIHHTAGVVSVEQLGRIFRNKQASSTYGIGSDGRIGQYVPEEYRPWTTSGWEPDRNCITIEVSNSKAGGAWPVSDYVLSRLIDLVTDICRRNGLTLNYTGNKTGNLLMHKWYASTACPGPYLASKFPYIAEAVNKRLSSNTTSASATASGKTPVIEKTIDQLAQEVLNGVWGNGAERRSRLVTGGYDYEAVQKRVNELLGIKNANGTTPVVDIDTLARDVLAGKYGNGADRKKALGSNYDAVQARVNQLLHKTNEPDIDQMAKDVLAGKYGNGAERRRRLGKNYAAVQKRVNEMLRGK